MQPTSLSSLIVVGTLLCVCSSVWGYWLPTSKIAALSHLDGSESVRESLPQDRIPLKTAAADAHARQKNVPLPTELETPVVRQADRELFLLQRCVFKETIKKKVDSVTDSFKVIGADAQGRPCCTSWGPGRVDCFIRAPKSNVMHISIDNGVYSEWEDLGGTIVDEIECVSRDVGFIDVLVLGTDIALWVNTFSGGKWSGWKSKGGRLMEVPSCAARTPEIVNCMLRGTTNKGYHIGAVNGQWTSYTDLGGVLFNPLGCSARGANNFNCFVSGLNLNLYQRYWIQGVGWQGYQNLKGLVKGRPSATSWSSNRIDVFSLGVKTDSVMQKTWIDGKGWQEWVDLGGVFDSAPECVTAGVGKIHCFAVGKESCLYRNSFDGAKWSGWIKSYGFYLETPSCVVSDEDEVACAIRRFNKEVVLLTHRF